MILQQGEDLCISNENSAELNYVIEVGGNSIFGSVLQTEKVVLAGPAVINRIKLIAVSALGVFVRKTTNSDNTYRLSPLMMLEEGGHADYTRASGCWVVYNSSTGAVRTVL